MSKKQQLHTPLYKERNHEDINQSEIPYHTNSYISQDVSQFHADQTWQTNTSLKYRPPPMEGLTEKEKREVMKSATLVMGSSQRGYAGIEKRTKEQQEFDTGFQRRMGIKPKTWMIMEQRKVDEVEEESEAEQMDIPDDLSMPTSQGDDTGRYTTPKRKRNGCCDLSRILQYLIIDHNGSLYTFWHESIDMLCIVSSFIYAHFASQRHADENLETTMLVIESIFLIDCLVSFIKDFEDINDPKGPAIRSLSKIFSNYTQGQFFYDIMALIPFQMLRLYRDRQDFLYVIKLIRLKRGFENLDVMDYQKMYKQSVQHSIEKKIEKQKKQQLKKKKKRNEYSIDEDDEVMQLEDQTRLGDILKCTLFMKMIKILIVISSASFFFAMIFRFIMQIESDIFNWDKFNESGEEEPEHFLSFYAFTSRSDYSQTIALIYFSFTTLSTVGFGDYNPRSDIERFYIAFGLLFGVMIFAVIMSEYQGVLEAFKEFDQTADDSANLNRFFNILKRYNNFRDMEPDTKSNIEAYFDYRWEVHKNQLLYESEESSYLDQLPDELIDNLLKKYLYNDFLKQYKRYFVILKPNEGRITNARYTWNDPDFNVFMRGVLANLEPIKYQRRQIILDELDEVNEVVFIMNAEYHVGFSINKKVHFQLKMKQSSIGDYNLTFNKKSQYVFKTPKECQAFFIRRKNWLQIINNEDIKVISSMVVQKLKTKYQNVLERNMNLLKNQMLQKISAMNKQVLQVTTNERQSSVALKKSMSSVSINPSMHHSRIQSTVHQSKDTTQPLLSDYEQEKQNRSVSAISIIKKEEEDEEVTVDQVLRKIEVFNEVFEYFLEKVSDDRLDLVLGENDTQNDVHDKIQMLENHIREQEEELITTRTELDFANQEIFNLRMKYNTLEKVNLNQRRGTMPENMESSIQFMDDEDSEGRDLGGTMKLAVKKLYKAKTPNRKKKK